MGYTVYLKLYRDDPDDTAHESLEDEAFVFIYMYTATLQYFMKYDNFNPVWARNCSNNSQLKTCSV